MLERHDSEVEIRAEGRRLSGTVLRYGDVSSSHRERFAPGSIRKGPSVILDAFHDKERVAAFWPDGGLELKNDLDALRMTANLPPIPIADRLLDEVRAGRVRGLSVEFNCLKDRFENGVRVVEDAVLNGIGVVSRPSYRDSTVEAREFLDFSNGAEHTVINEIKFPPHLYPNVTGPRYRRIMREDHIKTFLSKYGPISEIERDSLIEWGVQNNPFMLGVQQTKRDQKCRCIKGKDGTKNCEMIYVTADAYKQMIRDTQTGKRDVIAHTGTYDAAHALGSVKSGGLRLSEGRNGNLLAALSPEAAHTQAGRALAQSVEAARPVMRPIIDQEASTWTERLRPGDGVGDVLVRTYTNVVLASLLVKWTTDSQGWSPIWLPWVDSEPPEDEEDEDTEDEDTEDRSQRRRVWL